MDKAALRSKYKRLRSAVTEEALEEMSICIANRSLELPIWDATYYHIFLPISEKKEINTEYLLHILHGRDKSVVLSKADFNTGQLKHYLLQENTEIVLSSYGIPEPKDGIQIDPKMLEVVFIPLLAFDVKGGRIGYGKGFYDRFLEQCNSNCLFVGLSMFEAEDSIPVNFQDIPLDYCIIPNKTYLF